MKLNEFLNFNKSCPICGNNLHLFMSWLPNQYNGVLFKASIIGDNPKQYRFDVLNKKYHDGKIKDEYVTLTDYENEVETKFSSKNILDESKRHSIYFFFLCNPEGIDYRGSGDHEINLYKGCYTRSTPFMELDETNKLKVSGDFDQLTHKAESFIIKHEVAQIQRIYALSIDYEDKKTTLMHYSVNQEQEKDPNFNPNVFEKEMPLLTHRPNLEDKEKLISRFDNWILIS